MQPGAFAQISSSPFLNNLPEDTLKDLTRAALLHRFPHGTELFQQGDLAEFLYILLDGSVELIGASAANRKTVVDILEPVEAFMPAEVTTNTPYLVSARVLGPSQILMIPAEALRARLAHDGALARAILGMLSRQHRRMIRHVKDLKLRNAAQRLGCFLLALADKAGGVGLVELPYDKRIVAAQLGMTPESLSRAFSLLRKFGLESRGQRIKLSDPRALRQFCLPDPVVDTEDGVATRSAA
jgi:CRP/FNR family transcriptional activator FtrB